MRKIMTLQAIKAACEFYLERPQEIEFDPVVQKGSCMP